jgi:flagellar hook-associated protein 1 FlgK
MADNLLTIGTSGVLTSNGLLTTTSNNISNVNTKGYVRQRTEYDSSTLGLGVGQGTTERLINEFTLKQLFRDTASAGFTGQFQQEANRVDSLFSNTANSIATGMSDLFKQMQTANNDPANTSSRLLVIGSAQTLVNKFGTLSSLVLEQRTYVNQQMDIYVSESNSLLTEIANLNKSIAGYGNGLGSPVPLDLLDKRDQAIRQLSSLMEVNTLKADNGEMLLFTSTGLALVMEQGKYNVFSAKGDPDPDRKKLTLQYENNANIQFEIDNARVGGKIGGLLQFRNELLEPTQNRLGQIALAIGDAFNTQNRLGMDANGQLGRDIFTTGSYQGLPLSSNTGTGGVTVSVDPGRGKELSPNEFKFTFVAPSSFRLEALDNNGAAIAGSDITVNAAALTTLDASTSGVGNFYHGLSIKLDKPIADFNNGDTFILKPLANAATSLQLATTRPEDIALASPVRGDFTTTNLGNGRVENIKVTNTGTGSQFTAPSTINGGPFTLTYTAANQFELRDASNTLLASPNFAAPPFNNVMDKASLSAYGFDFSITGIPRVGDTFTVKFNEGGFRDNRNGLLMANLQNTDLVRKTAVATANADNTSSLNEAYASMVGFVGDKTSQGRIAAASAQSLLAQTESWYESTSGVNLDEEAANLIRFQQSYAAAAKIISASQTIFDTLLQAAR